MELDMDNEAFEAQPAIELARILRVTRHRVMDGELEGPCMDSNGNRVGQWAVTTAPEEAEPGD